MYIYALSIILQWAVSFLGLWMSCVLHKCTTINGKCNISIHAFEIIPWMYFIIKAYYMWNVFKNVVKIKMSHPHGGSIGRILCTFMSLGSVVNSSRQMSLKSASKPANFWGYIKVFLKWLDHLTFGWKPNSEFYLCSKKVFFQNTQFRFCKYH